MALVFSPGGADQKGQWQKESEGQEEEGTARFAKLRLY